MVVVTLLIRIIHPQGLTVCGFQDLQFDTTLSIRNNGGMILGKRTTTFKGVLLAVNGGRLMLGEHVFFNRNCNVVARNQISIGNHCIFGPNVSIFDHNHMFDHNGIVLGVYKTSPIMIEDNCWIGANVTILRGTHIGEGCVIGAGAVVQGEIPAHSIVTNDRTIVIRPILERT